jgi:acetyl esterase/lipase
VDVSRHIDPEIAAALAVSPVSQMDFGALEYSELPALREMMNNAPRPPGEWPARVTYRDDVAPGRDGAPDVPVRIYTPTEASGSPATDAPAILWIHGGGYMFGTGLGEDPRLARWCNALDAIVVSVEYRLAPEHPYPAPLDDCYAALAWTVQHAVDLGIDPARIAVAGASAGGGLAAALALLARDRAEYSLAYQLLIYPMIDDRMATRSSTLDTVVWTTKANVLGWRAYLGHEPGVDGVPGYAAAARADELAGLPPAWIGVGALDVFRDENIEYAQRLLGAGVAAELHVYPGAPHGFEAMCPDAAVARQCQSDIDAALRRALT